MKLTRTTRAMLMQYEGRYGVQQTILESSWMLRITVTSLCIFQIFLTFIPSFIISSTGARSGALATGGALASIHYVMGCVLMQ